MRKEKVITYYGNMSEFELSTVAGRILKAMQEPATAASFPDMYPDLVTLDQVVNDYIRKHEIASRRGSALEISQKDESKAALLDALKNLANHVNDVAKGQLSLLLSTGMILASQASTLLVPLVTERIQLRDGRISGQMRLDFKKVVGAWEYEIEIGQSTEPDGTPLYDRLVTTTSSRSNVLSDFTPGIRYYVRIRARNGRGLGDWSEPVSLIAR